MIVKEENLITQKTFRTLLQAMSHPGRVYKLDHNTKIGNQITDKNNPFSVFFALLPLLQTLLDHEVTFNVFGHQREEWEYRVIRATGSRTVNIDNADFIIIPSGDSDGAILHAKRGSLEYPDTGATVIYVVKFLNDMDKDNGKLIALLRGPGIKDEIAISMHGLGKNELSHIKEINSEFPLGIDCIFIDGANRIMSIPRSAKIEVI